jgi:hypothetical protein
MAMTAPSAAIRLEVLRYIQPVERPEHDELQATGYDVRSAYEPLMRDGRERVVRRRKGPMRPDLEVDVGTQ